VKGAEGARSRTWGGRFAEPTARDALAFTASIGFDVRLYPYDLRTSMAHAKMLAATKIISAADCRAIVGALEEIGAELDAGSFVPRRRGRRHPHGDRGTGSSRRSARPARSCTRRAAATTRSSPTSACS
jgi:hypothetical protein